jgi:flagellar L-ring protein precursor FlgH
MSLWFVAMAVAANVTVAHAADKEKLTAAEKKAAREAEKAAKAAEKAEKKAKDAEKDAKKDLDAETRKTSENYDELFRQYLATARATANAPQSADSLWMAGLADDLRAHRLNDLVTVRVTEIVSGEGSADSALDKDSNVSASVTSLFGAENKLPGWLDPSALAAASANSKFKGSGTTGRSGSLTAVMTARVAEVLPNGDLALEGVREIEINGDRQIIVLTGVVRPVDITQGNVVPSSAIGQMRIRYFGKGLIKDNLQPGLLVRILNKIF